MARNDEGYYCDVCRAQLNAEEVSEAERTGVDVCNTDRLSPALRAALKHTCDFLTALAARTASYGEEKAATLLKRILEVTPSSSDSNQEWIDLPPVRNEHLAAGLIAIASIVGGGRRAMQVLEAMYAVRTKGNGL